MINFSKTFTTDFIHCGKIDLPWDKVKKDLESVADDQTKLISIVGHNSLINEELYNLQNEYAKYGYTQHNTKLWKTTNGIEPKLTFDWEQDINNQLPLDYTIATVTRQDPGQVLPWHVDRYFFLKNQYPNDPRPIWRFLMFMEDWKIGHIVQVKNSVFTHWKQGDVITWQPGEESLHVTANIGLEKKWTCNITGFLTV
jgi:hypothetical protein